MGSHVSAPQCNLPLAVLGDHVVRDLVLLVGSQFESSVSSMVVASVSGWDSTCAAVAASALVSGFSAGDFDGVAVAEKS